MVILISCVYFVLNNDSMSICTSYNINTTTFCVVFVYLSNRKLNLCLRPNGFNIKTIKTWYCFYKSL